MRKLSKIIATLGPASQSPETIRALILAGVDVFRLNFSHGVHDVLTQVITDVRQISAELGKPVALLGDLQGPKFRVGQFIDAQGQPLESIPLVVGETIIFSASTEPGGPGHITTPVAQIVEAVGIGDTLLINDGMFELVVTQRNNLHELLCTVIKGGELKPRKGINVPGVRLNVAALTQKDQDDARFALNHQLEFLALSFVQAPEDLMMLRQLLESWIEPPARVPYLVAKIERPQAVENIDAILAATDVIMVARGDLGVELKPEAVPVIQKQLIQKANAAGKPVITATQMLESMIESPVPTRAEVSDVANAILDGSDAIMLSGESASGRYPVESVSMMHRIILEVEQASVKGNGAGSIGEQLDLAASWLGTLRPSTEFHQVIAHAAVVASKKAEAKAIVVFSYTGSMVRRVSKEKPHCPIVGLSPSLRICRQMAILRGVYPMVIEASHSVEESMAQLHTILEQQTFLQPEDPMVLCAGLTNLESMTNTLKLSRF